MITIHKGTAVAVAFTVMCGSFVTASPAYGGSSVSVLCYHSFLDKKKKDPFSFTLDELSSQVEQLKNEGFRFVSISDVMDRRIRGSRNVLITVDDGNRSVIEAYNTVFRPNGIRPLLGIYPNIIGKKKYALTWEELDALANSGCDIAAHGYFHLKLNQELYDNNPRYFKREIYESKKVLEEKLNRTISVFVYPFGLRSDMAIRMLRDAGYRYAFTINGGIIDMPVFGFNEGVYELPRYMVTRTSWNYCFSRVMQNAQPKGSHRVAAALKAPVERADIITDSRAGERWPDPVAELQTVLENKAVIKSARAVKTDWKKKPPEHQNRKKKQDNRTDMLFGPARAAEQDKGPASNDSRRYEREGLILSGPVDISIPSVPDRREHRIDRPDVFEPDRSAAPRERDKRSPFAILEAAPTGVYHPQEENMNGTGNNPVLEGRVAYTVSGYHLKIKNQYQKVNGQSYNTYSIFLSMVKDKVGRIKHAIKRYVLNHF
ncbi:MAG: hypothetical protein A2176_06380 [Spirochaetes bacterium RBG_13_51_14]|nr:MAG: hypothetical protein A2176_06380 [Spirochaetes bacterium RBG_13_51_14]